MARQRFDNFLKVVKSLSYHPSWRGTKPSLHMQIKNQCLVLEGNACAFRAKNQFVPLNVLCRDGFVPRHDGWVTSNLLQSQS
jgi:hypothetical protein